MTVESKTARLLGDIRLVDQFICVSDFQRNIMAKSGVPNEKLATLHNFVETTKAAEPATNKGYLLYFGRIEELKGLQTLIAATAKTQHDLIIAGNGSWEPELVREVEKWPNIKFVGFQSGKPLDKLINNASAVVVPSEWYENCPMSLLEAKASGISVIGARMGGIPELIRNGKDGFLFEPGDIDSLAKSLNAFDAADHTELVNAARADAKARFSAWSHYKALMNIYAHARRSCCKVAATGTRNLF